MKCFYHPDRDAVGMCGRCAKAICRACAEDVAAGLLCPQCLQLMQEEEALKEQQEAIEAEAQRQLIVKHARRTIMWSWIVTAALVLPASAMIIIGASASDDLTPAQRFLMPLFIIPFWVYEVWAWYWGFVFLRERWGRRLGGEGEGPGCALVLVFLFLALIVGFFGAGIYEFLHYRKLVRQGQ